jgi:hypothetical protein
MLQLDLLLSSINEKKYSAVWGRFPQLNDDHHRVRYVPWPAARLRLALGSSFAAGACGWPTPATRAGA